MSWPAGFVCRQATHCFSESASFKEAGRDVKSAIARWHVALRLTNVSSLVWMAWPCHSSANQPSHTLELACTASLFAQEAVTPSQVLIAALHSLQAAPLSPPFPLPVAQWEMLAQRTGLAAGFEVRESPSGFPIICLKSEKWTEEPKEGECGGRPWQPHELAVEGWLRGNRGWKCLF